MKRIIGICVLLQFSLLAVAQNGKTFVCSYYGDMVSQEILNGKLPLGFITPEEAVKAVDNILSPTGLKRNFIILEDGRVANASALIYKEKRYVLYNNGFMEMVKSLTKNNWAETSIMAHEIGHHLQGHTSESGGSRPEIELEADEYSGWIMYMLGASLQDAQVAMNKLASEQDGPTHPGKFKRLNSIQEGWSRAARKYPRQSRVAGDESMLEKTPTYKARFLYKSRSLSAAEQKRNGGNTHEFMLYVDAVKEELENIESVTYHLHRTFSNPNQTIVDPDGGFKLTITVWGEFEVGATIRYKDGTTKELKKSLSFSGN